MERKIIVYRKKNTLFEFAHSGSLFPILTMDDLEFEQFLAEHRFLMEDGYTNETNRSQIFLLKSLAKDFESIKVKGQLITLTFLPFPQLASILLNSKDKNLLQLAVQCLSYPADALDAYEVPRLDD